MEARNALALGAAGQVKLVAAVAAVGAKRDRGASGGEVGVARGSVARLASADGEAGSHGLAALMVLAVGIAAFGGFALVRAWGNLQMARNAKNMPAALAAKLAARNAIAQY